MKIMVDHRNSENELIQLENIRIVLGKHWDIIHTNRGIVYSFRQSRKHWFVNEDSRMFTNIDY